jgi:hypothetical protein
MQLVETDPKVRSALKANPAEVLKVHGLSATMVRKLANDIYGSDDGCNDGTCYVSACPDTCFVTVCGTTGDLTERTGQTQVRAARSRAGKAKRA